MIKQVHEIDSEGFIVKAIEFEFDENGDCLNDHNNDIVLKPVPQGLYKAKWDGTDWVEGFTQNEINALYNGVKEPTQEVFLLDLDFRLSTLELGL